MAIGTRRVEYKPAFRGHYFKGVPRLELGIGKGRENTSLYLFDTHTKFRPARGAGKGIRAPYFLAPCLVAKGDVLPGLECKGLPIRFGERHTEFHSIRG